jgi:dethiobiotin synthetase
MNGALPDAFYVTGTDTDVGKTIVCALLCRALGATYWKPVQAGCDPMTDRQRVEAFGGVATLPERFVLGRAASPHAAAQDDGVRIGWNDFELPATRPLVVEGAGGLMVPYSTDPVLWQSGLIAALGLPVVVVARSGLGTLNHTSMTLRCLAADGLRVCGLILVGPEHPENQRDLVALNEVPLLARVDWVGDLDAEFDGLAAKLRVDLASRLNVGGPHPNSLDPKGAVRQHNPAVLPGRRGTLPAGVE